MIFYFTIFFKITNYFLLFTDYEREKKRKQCIKNAAEGKRLVAKGLLSYNLHRLRDALGVLFITSYWQGYSSSKNVKWLKLINRDRSHGSTGRIRRFLNYNNMIKNDINISPKFDILETSIISSYFQFFISFLSSIFGQIDTSITVEYKAVINDLLVLSSPDYEISGLRKIATAVRMRNTYRCLIPPKVY